MLSFPRVLPGWLPQLLAPAQPQGVEKGASCLENHWLQGLSHLFPSLSPASLGKMFGSSWEPGKKSLDSALSKGLQRFYR